MITLDNIAQYFISAGLITTGNIYIGKSDIQKEQIIGLYNGTTTENTIAIGGINNTGSEKVTFTVFIHWNKSYKDTQNKAIAIYEYFRTNQSVTIGTKKTFNIECTSGQPIYIDTDKNNIHEFVLDYTISYNR